MATTDLHFVAGALHPVRHGVRFLGGNVDDQIEINAAGVAAASAAHTNGTFIADIMVPDNTGTYAIISFGDASLDDFITLSVIAGKLNVESQDGGVVDFLVVSTDVVINPHQLHRVAVVQNGTRPTLYVDGLPVAMTDTTSTDLTTWFDQLTAIDSGSIGAAEEGGAGALTNEFAGYIGDVMHYGSTDATGSLTAAQILADFEGTRLTTTLLNHWVLVDDLLDTGSRSDNGTFVGDLIHSSYNEFASRLTFLETVPLTANNTVIMADGGVGFAYSPLAA